MLELIARHADVWNGWIANRRTHPDVVPPLRQAVDAACMAVGRDPASLERIAHGRCGVRGKGTWGGAPLTGSVEEIASAFHAFAREGISHLHVWLNPMTPDGIEQLSDVLRQLDRETW